MQFESGPITYHSGTYKRVGNRIIGFTKNGELPIGFDFRELKITARHGWYGLTKQPPIAGYDFIAIVPQWASEVNLRIRNEETKEFNLKVTHYHSEGDGINTYFWIEGKIPINDDDFKYFKKLESIPFIRNIKTYPELDRYSKEELEEYLRNRND